MTRARWRWAAPLAVVLSGGCAMIFGLDDLGLRESTSSEAGAGGTAGGGGEGGEGGGGAGGQGGVGGQGGEGGAPVVWSQRFGGAEDEFLLDMAVGPEDRIAIVGSSAGPASFGGEELPGSGTGNEDLFVAVLDADGGHLWSRRLGDTAAQRAYGVAFDSAANVIVAGAFIGDLDFGAPTTALSTAGGQDVFVAKLAANSGDAIWAKRFGSTGAQSGGRVEVTSNDDITLLGTFLGSLDFGAPTTELTTPPGGWTIFVAQLDGDGDAVWSASFGDDAVQQPWDLDLDASDNILLTGEFAGTMNFGGTDLVATNPRLFIASLSDAGSHNWSNAFGSGGDAQTGWSIAAAEAGRVVVAGSFDGTLDFGGSPLDTTAEKGAFAAKFDGSGAPLWSQAYGTEAKHIVYAVDVHTTGLVLIGGRSESPIDFGLGLTPHGGAGDAFVALISANSQTLWSLMVGDADEQDTTAVAFTSTGEILVGGNFQNSVSFGDELHNTQGKRDCFLAKLPAFTE